MAGSTNSWGDYAMERKVEFLLLFFQQLFHLLGVRNGPGRCYGAQSHVTILETYLLDQLQRDPPPTQPGGLTGVMKVK